MARSAPAQDFGSRTPAFSSARPDLRLLDEVGHIGTSRSSLAFDSFSLHGGVAGKPLVLPLSIALGGGGVSFLYARPAALTLSDGARPVWNPRPAAYGMSNHLALGQVQLSGVLSLSDGQALSAISQSLTYAAHGWNLQAHFLSVDKNAHGLSTLRDASSGAGPVAGTTGAELGKLDSLRGTRDLGFATGYSASGGHVDFAFQNVSDAVHKTDSRRQSLSLGKSFRNGLALEASREITDGRPQGGGRALTGTSDHLSLSLAPGRGTALSFGYQSVADTSGKSDARQSLLFSRSFGRGNQFAMTHDTESVRLRDGAATVTTATDHVSLNLAPCRGAVFSTEGLMIHGSRGRSEEHWTSHLAYATPVLSLAADLETHHAVGGRSDRTLAMDLSRQSGTVTLHGTWKQFSSSSVGAPGQVSQSLQMTWHPRRALNLDGAWIGRQNPDGRRGAQQNRRMHLTCRLLRDIDLDLLWSQDDDERTGRVETRSRASHTLWQLGGPLTRALRWSAHCEQSDRTGYDGTQDILVGVQGTVGTKQNLEVSLGRRQQVVGDTVVSGPTCRLAYECKADDADFVTFNGDLTSWDTETTQTPSSTDANVRVDWKKEF